MNSTGNMCECIKWRGKKQKKVQNLVVVFDAIQFYFTSFCFIPSRYSFSLSYSSKANWMWLHLVDSEAPCLEGNKISHSENDRSALKDNANKSQSMN